MRIGISGSPGTGKTTLAKGVSDGLGICHADISQLAREMGWIVEHDAKRDTDVVDLALAKEYIDSLESVIIDSHYADQFDCDIVIVMRCPPKILYRRLTARGYALKKIKDNLLSEILDTCLINAIEAVGAENTFEIVSSEPEKDIATAKSIIETRDEVLSVKKTKRVHYLTESNLDLAQRF